MERAETVTCGSPADRHVVFLSHAIRIGAVVRLRFPPHPSCARIGGSDGSEFGRIEGVEDVVAEGMGGRHGEGTIGERGTCG